MSDVVPPIWLLGVKNEMFLNVLSGKISYTFGQSKLFLLFSETLKQNHDFDHIVVKNEIYLIDLSLFEGPYRTLCSPATIFKVSTIFYQNLQ